MASVYESLTPPQKKRYKSLLSSAKSMQNQGKLMFKDLEKLKNKAKDQINDMLKKLDKDYTSMRKSGGLLPERNIKAARALKRKKK